MKKMFMTLVIVLVSLVGAQAMSTSNIRQHARFISDRMAYELDLAPWQYEECYEINYDFIYSIDRIMDDVAYGYYDAIDRYYSLLDDRNDDLRFVLNVVQYTRFMTREYFYRPVYTSGRNWYFRIYTIYSNRSFFYYDAPTIYRVYAGAHSRSHHVGGYYATRVPNNHGAHHEIYRGNDHRISGSQHYQNHGRNDFGANRVQRQQNNHKPQRENYYSNGNQKDRTHDNRYHDNSGNHQSPQINARGEKPGERRQGNTNQQSQGNANQHPQGNTNQHSQGNANQHPQGNTNQHTQGNARPQGSNGQQSQGNANQRPGQPASRRR